MGSGEGLRLITLLTKTSGRHLLTEAYCEPQKEDKDVRVCNVFLPGYFFIMNGTEERKLYGCKGRNYFVFNPHLMREKPADVNKLNAIRFNRSLFYWARLYAPCRRGIFWPHQHSITLLANFYWKLFAPLHHFFLQLNCRHSRAGESESQRPEHRRWRAWSSDGGCRHCAKLELHYNTISTITADTHICYVGSGKELLNVSGFRISSWRSGRCANWESDYLFCTSSHSSENSWKI